MTKVPRKDGRAVLRIFGIAGRLPFLEARQTPLDSCVCHLGSHAGDVVDTYVVRATKASANGWGLDWFLEDVVHRLRFSV